MARPTKNVDAGGRLGAAAPRVGLSLTGLVSRAEWLKNQNVLKLRKPRSRRPVTPGRVRSLNGRRLPRTAWQRAVTRLYSAATAVLLVVENLAHFRRVFEMGWWNVGW